MELLMQRSNEKISTIFGNYPKHILPLNSLKFFLMAKFSLGHILVKRKISFKKEKKIQSFKQFVVFKFQITANESIRAGNLCDLSQLYNCES